ncbi:RHS repeat-associated core domain-containing protein [Streptomyces sp. B-S-A6]|uniref:RHS repeat-associated core domain-containing protein n=1 Tax=Streptomyces cavernicola TaxID=3043613 RepID=A0ABT6SB27_9ACTN|nr:RHS repeat-associated core domain-containing protein [Streptomyces sp. B-S-A6]MDI3405407.1 RHS repeat-associated core domain-containing protein [Streptomyces sp. B-S-A6]
MNGETVVEQVDFTWDGATLIEQTTTTSSFLNPVSLTWDHDGLTPIAQTERTTDEATQAEVDSRFFAIITDLVGTPSELISEQGDIAWRTRTTLWGTTTWNADATTYTPLRFPGQYHDPETGFHYNFHRHYDPATARFAASDPLGLEPAPNPYAYVHNPHTWIDYLGLAGKGPKDPLDFGQGYRGRLDHWPEGDKGVDFEIHVYDKSGREVGLFGSDGWFDKHGTVGANVDVPASVENALKGRAVDFMRRTGRIGEKGTEDISGDKWKRPRLAAEESGCK